MRLEQRNEGISQQPEGSQVGLRNPAYGISQEERVSLWDRESIDLKASCFIQQGLPSPHSSLWFLWAPPVATVVCSFCGLLSLSDLCARLVLHLFSCREPFLCTCWGNFYLMFKNSLRSPLLVSFADDTPPCSHAYHCSCHFQLSIYKSNVPCI